MSQSEIHVPRTPEALNRSIESLNIGVLNIVQNALGVKQLYVVGALLALIPSLFAFDIGRTLLWNSIGIAYPVYRSTVALNEMNQPLIQNWLMYWASYAMCYSVGLFGTVDIVRTVGLVWCVYSVGTKSGTHAIYKYVLSPGIGSLKSTLDSALSNHAHQDQGTPVSEKTD